MLKLAIGLVFCVLLGAETVRADDSPDSAFRLDDVVVTASRVPSLQSDLSRSVVVISRSEIAVTPARSVSELLSGAAGVDIRHRGGSGVQADFNIRGSGFEQTLILIDGIKFNDPQTGHHNGDIPVAIEDIERIEILKGAGSRLYGPNAMGGVINIITNSAKNKSMSIKSGVGDFGLFERSLRASYFTGPVSHLATFSKRNSTSHRDNTEFDIVNVSYDANITAGPGPITFSARYTDKSFGAHQFYSVNFPDEYEATETTFISSSAELNSGNFTFSPKLFWKRHEDDFILDRNRPDWYRNRHTTDMYGGELQASLTSSKTVVTVGGEIAGEEIESTNLDDHYRTRAGVFSEVSWIPIEKLSVVAGLSLYAYTDDKWTPSPGIDAGYHISNDVRVYASVGKSFRMPTFTDLYYYSPANRGNPELFPEEGWTFETGIVWQNNSVSVKPSIFLREGRDMIDYIWTEDSVWTGDSIWTVDSYWQAENVSQSTTRGFELNTGFNLIGKWEASPLASANFRYTYLDIEWYAGNRTSKYFMDHLRHQAVLDISTVEFLSITNSWRVRYQERFNSQKYAIVDVKLDWKYQGFNIYADVTNLFDREYSEIGTIPMPGRWFRMGMSYSLSLE